MSQTAVLSVILFSVLAPVLTNIPLADQTLSSSVPVVDMVIKAVDLVNDKVIDGISEVRDESGRQGLRIVFDLKKDEKKYCKIINSINEY